jgi:hypothetical protein
MFRFFYRYIRRNLHGLRNDEDIIRYLTKWWFDTIRNLMIASLLTFYAVRSGSWLAHILAHISFIIFALFLFQPVFNFLMRANRSGNAKVERKRVTMMGMWMFLNVFGPFVGATYALIFAVSKLQAP